MSQSGEPHTMGAFRCGFRVGPRTLQLRREVRFGANRAARQEVQGDLVRMKARVGWTCGHLSSVLLGFKGWSEWM